MKGIADRRTMHVLPALTTIPNSAAIESTEGAWRAADAILRELAWREFAIALLHHFPHMADQPMHGGSETLPRWQRGMTGIPHHRCWDARALGDWLDA